VRAYDLGLRSPGLSGTQQGGRGKMLKKTTGGRVLRLKKKPQKKKTLKVTGGNFCLIREGGKGGVLPKKAGNGTRGRGSRRRGIRSLERAIEFQKEVGLDAPRGQGREGVGKANWSPYNPETQKATGEHKSGKCGKSRTYDYES